LGIAFPVMELFFSILTVKALGSSEKTDYWVKLIINNYIIITLIFKEEINMM
jgi:hypothetical protein